MVLPETTKHLAFCLPLSSGWRLVVLAGGSSISCAVLSLQTQVLVDPELAGARVAGSEDGKSDDDSERPKFGRDLSELSQTLGDSVASLVFGRRSTHHASRGLHSHDLSGIHIGQMSGGGGGEIGLVDANAVLLVALERLDAFLVSRPAKMEAMGPVWTKEARSQATDQWRAGQCGPPCPARCCWPPQSGKSSLTILRLRHSSSLCPSANRTIPTTKLLEES